MFHRNCLQRRNPLSAAIAALALTTSTVFWAAGAAAQDACRATSEPATIAVKPGKYGRNDLDQVGMNHQDPQQPWADAGIIEALNTLDPVVLRYPGGTVSTYWDHRNDNLLLRKTPGADGWVDETLVRSFVASLLLDPAPGNSLEFLALAQAENGFAPLYVINMTTPGADFYEEAWERALDPKPGSPDMDDDWWLMLEDRTERALDMLRRADALGLPVEHIELGNEYYFVQDYMRFLVDPVAPYDDQTPAEVYSKAANYMAGRIKEEFPEAKIAAISAETRDDDGFIRQEWNVEVMEHLDPAVIDAVSLHVYIETGTTSIDSQEEILRMARTWREQWRERYQLAQLDLIEDRPYEVWITELATNFYTPEITQTWGNSLINSVSIHFLATENNYEMALLQQFREAYNPANYELSNLGIITNVWSRASRDATRRAELKFSVLDRDLRPQSAQLFLGDVFSTETGEYRYLFMNFADRDVSLDVSRLRHPQLTCEAHFAENLNSLTATTVSAAVTSTRILVPRHSLILLETASED